MLANNSKRSRKAARAKVVVAVQAVALAAMKTAGKRQRPCSRLGRPTRVRKQVQHIYDQLGPIYFQRAFRMNYSLFQKLARKLEDKIIEKSQKNPLASFQRYVPNGPITPSVRLACAAPLLFWCIIVQLDGYLWYWPYRCIQQHLVCSRRHQ